MVSIGFTLLAKIYICLNTSSCVKLLMITTLLKRLFQWCSNVHSFSESVPSTWFLCRPMKFQTHEFNRTCFAIRKFIYFPCYRCADKSVEEISSRSWTNPFCLYIWSYISVENPGQLLRTQAAKGHLPSSSSPKRMLLHWTPLESETKRRAWVSQIPLRIATQSPFFIIGLFSGSWLKPAQNYRNPSIVWC